MPATALDRRLAAAQATEPTRRRQETLERERERVQASKAMQRLVTAYWEDLLSLEELRRREQGATAQLRSIADHTAERTATLRLAEGLSAFLTRLRTRAQTLDIHERQRIVRLLVKDALVANHTIVIRHSIPVHAPHPDDSDLPPPPPESRSPSGDQHHLLCPRRDQPAGVECLFARSARPVVRASGQTASARPGLPVRRRCAPGLRAGRRRPAGLGGAAQACWALRVDAAPREDTTAQRQALSRKLRGHHAYYGITGNARALSRFRFAVQRRWREWLNRRSHATRLDWPAFNRRLTRYPLPPARVVHRIYA